MYLDAKWHDGDKMLVIGANVCLDTKWYDGEMC